MDIKYILPFWFIILPLTIYLLFILYTIITELLDLIFNGDKINRLLIHSDILNPDSFLKDLENQKRRQSSLDKSNLQEMERQINYARLKNNKNNWTFRYDEKEKIITAKEMSDIFRVK